MMNLGLEFNLFKVFYKNWAHFLYYQLNNIVPIAMLAFLSNNKKVYHLNINVELFLNSTNN